jgi:hypothetical protein
MLHCRNAPRKPREARASARTQESWAREETPAIPVANNSELKTDRVRMIAVDINETRLV